MKRGAKTKTETKTTALQVSSASPSGSMKPKRPVARIKAKVKPTKGYAHVFYLLFSAVLPIIVYVLVRTNFVLVAVAVVFISKWRMFAVRPRFWMAIMRANAADIIVTLSSIVFMSQTHSTWLQLSWMMALIIWQILVKPSRSTFGVSAQAVIAQTYGLGALFVFWPAAPLINLVVFSWVICYLSARHFLANFDEPHAPLYAHVWGYFAAALVWISAHWLLYYMTIAQPVLLLTVLGFGLGGLYYLRDSDKLSDFLRRQIVLIMVAVVVVVFMFSDWGSKIV